jgi:ubiquinol-cytochrome c reductase cytochrome b subunit
MQLSPEEMAGVGYFRAENCASCHSLSEGTTGIGPDLTRTTRRTAAWMIQHFKSPAGVRPGSSMPPIQLNDSQLNTLAAFLLKLNPDNAAAISSAPDFAIQGALLYQARGCSDCHVVNGSGSEVGPTLNGLAKRRTRSWVEEHFGDPPKLSPGSVMPPYKFSEKDMDNLVTYLFSLPE